MLNQAHHSDDFLTVSELNNFIRKVLTSGFPQALWVCGEIQELRDKKHLYFTLSEKDQDSNAIVAKIGVTIWANVRPKIEAVLQKAENAFVLKDDIEVKLLCSVEFYPPFGQVRLICEAIDPTYTLGKIAQDRQRLISLLKQKGILEKNKQLPMPVLPISIGLITSYESAAYHDFVAELKKSSYAFSVRIVDSIMQGKTTETSVSSAIKLLNRKGGIDVIVITRGGGSIADLSWFDSQMIAEAVASSKIPIISGIGHEINTTVTDLAAHTFAKTPTAVAAFLIHRIEEFLKAIKEKQNSLFSLIDQRLQERREHVKNQALTLRHSTQEAIAVQQGLMSRLTETFRRLPLFTIKNARKQNLQCKEDLKRTIQLRLQTSKIKMDGYQKFVQVIDPKNMLKRGFSITRDSKGKIIKTIKGLKGNIKIQLRDGVIDSEIKEIVKGVYEF